MLKIAICDDEPQAAAQEEAIVRDSLRACGIAGEVTRYTHSQTLLDDLTDDGFFYDLLLLDIEMPGLDGMEMARRCREILPKVRIIFVTSHREYAIDAFELSIFRYVPKSDRETRLAAAVTDAAKLYHDLHNHIEVLCHCLDEGDLGAARRYCQDLRGPVEEMAHTVWTGDPAVDHLITSKTARAQALGAQTQVNVEFPRNTDIRGVDLTAILGNLLDEPASGLDFASTEFLYTLLREYPRRGTVLFSSHILESLCLTAGRVVVLEGGKLTRAFSGGAVNPETIREALGYAPPDR